MKERMTAMSDNKIITRGLCKVYHTFEKEQGLKGSIAALFAKKRVEKAAVRGFNLDIEKGELVGLIGPNGAGKTTLIKMLTGVIYPTLGEVSVFGYTPCRLEDEFKKSYAVVMGQKSQLWWDLPALDSFLLNKEIYEIPEAVYRKNLSFFTELFEVGDLLKTQVRNLSLGERMKMELISALLHSPGVLFLDEPTIGLDAIAQKQIRQFLKYVNEERGVTIILTSHYMEDIKHLCKRTVVVREGVKLYDGRLDTLLERYQQYRTVRVSFETAVDLHLDFGVEWLVRNPYKVVFKVKKGDVKAVLQRVMANTEIEDISIEEEEIGSVVERIYGLEAGDGRC